MKPAKKDHLITWLNSAYAMEINLIKVLESHTKGATEFPELQAKLEGHLLETRRHAERVKFSLGLLGETPSTAKSVVGNLTGIVQGASSAIFEDEMVKNVLSDYAAEHFEIGCYTSLIAAAHESGHPEIAEIAREILQEEEAMADWLEQKIPEVTRMFLQLQAVAS